MQSFAEAAAAGVAPGRRKRLRVAFTPDLGGIAPVEAETAALCRAAAERFSVMGAAVVEACPDLRDAAQVFQVHSYFRNKCMYVAFDLLTCGHLSHMCVDDILTDSLSVL